MGATASTPGLEEQLVDCLARNQATGIQRLLDNGLHAQSPASAAIAVTVASDGVAADFVLPLNALQLRDNGFSILHLAVCACPARVISDLLRQGADPSRRSASSVPLQGRDASLSERGEYMYRSALELELRGRHVKPRSKEQDSWSLRYADRLPRGLIAELRYREHGFTPLMLACIFSEDDHVLEVVTALLEHAATRRSINAATPECGWSAVMFVAQRGMPQLWSLLLDHGANISQQARGMHGSAMDIAAELGGARVAQSLSAESELRSLSAAATQSVLGDEIGMAQVCVELCLAYTGLHNGARGEPDAPEPYMWPPFEEENQETEM